MDERAKKLSELPDLIANGLSNGVLLYAVANGVSYAVNVATLAEHILSLEPIN